jgi:hypothetical protein
MAKSKKNTPSQSVHIYVPKEDKEFYFYIGAKYYYRQMPIPYPYENKFIKKVKEILGSKN